MRSDWLSVLCLSWMRQGHPGCTKYSFACYAWTRTANLLRHFASCSGLTARYTLTACRPPPVTWVAAVAAVAVVTAEDGVAAERDGGVAMGAVVVVRGGGVVQPSGAARASKDC